MDEVRHLVDQPLVAGALLAAFASAALLLVTILVAVRRAIRDNAQLVAVYRREVAERGRVASSLQFLKNVTTKKLHQGSALTGLRGRVAPNLSKAGYHSEVTPEVFLGGAIVEGLCVFAGIIVVGLLAYQQLLLLPAAGLGALHALWIRPYLLRSEAEKRIRQISRRLPASLDLAVLTLEGGGTLTESLKQVAQGDMRDPFAQEISAVLEAMQAGQPQSKALEDMAKRLELEDLSTLVLAINRGEEMGAPMKQTLRTQADVLRFRRYQRAEKLINEAPVKMMLPNMLIMLATLLVVLGPIVIKVAKGDLL